MIGIIVNIRSGADSSSGKAIKKFQNVLIAMLEELVSRKDASEKNHILEDEYGMIMTVELERRNDMNVIETKKAPGAIGPYSQGIVVNGMIYTSGQIPVNPETGEIPEGITAQAEQSCKNIGAILEAAGGGFEQVFKTTCFLADMGDFAAFNEAYAKYFVSKPARSCVAVKELPKGVLCEIEAVAVQE